MPAEEQQSEAESQEARPFICQLAPPIIVQQGGDNRFADVGMRRAHKDHTARESSHGRDLHVLGRIGNDGQEKLEQLLLVRARVGEPESHYASGPYQRVLVVQLVGVAEQSHRRVRIESHARVHDANGEVGACLDRFLLYIGVLVDEVQAGLDIPQEQTADRGDGRGHTLILGLPDPVLFVLLDQHELVVAKAGVDKSIHKSRGKVVSGRIQVGHACNPAAL